MAALALILFALAACASLGTRLAAPKVSVESISVGGIQGADAMVTLSLRVEKQSANALEIARWLETHPAIERVFYPGLESHPQYAIAKKQQKAGGAIVSFELKGETREEQRANAWRVIDATKICSITGNLGDTRTTITHPSTTTHGRLTPEVREAAGIREGLIRLAVGLENAGDIRADLERGLNG